MYIAICDEDAVQRRVLTDAVRTALAKESLSFQIREYARVQELLYDVQDGDCVDAIFIDMAMAGGWEGVLTLRRFGYEGFLVLMSDCRERILDGYTVEADGYLTKPFDVGCVRELLARLCLRARKACLTVRCHSRIVRVPYHEILYIESRNARCVIHRLGHTEHILYAHLDDLERELADARFLRCHQSYLVNMDHIIAADRQFMMSNGDTVSIRQRELRHLREQYHQYVRPTERKI